MTASGASDLSAVEVSQRLAEAHRGGIVDQPAFRGEQTSIVRKENLIEVLRFLRDELGFDHLSDVTAADYIGQSPRFQVVYNLFSFASHIWYRVKVGVEDGESVPTAVNLWPCANWAEREVWDLFGIPFEGHPNLYRIMLPENWVGHPLRKDYPMSQITLPRAGSTKIPE